MTRFPQSITIDRRALLSHAALLVGGALLPANVSAAGKIAGKVARGVPFTPSQLDIVAAYADTLIPQTKTPGAIQAGVPRAVDDMMRNWASAKTHGEFASVLDALDEAAKKSAGRGLAELPPNKRHEVVSAFDAAQIAAQEKPTSPAHEDAEKRALPAIAAKHLANSDGDRIASDKSLHQQEKSSTGARLVDGDAAKGNKPKASADDPVAALAGHYIRLKDLVLTTYYLSEPGATEELRFELIPGVWDASMRLGSDRRAWAV